MERITLSEASDAVGGVLHGDGGIAVSGVSTDTRTIAEGMLFIPITGENHDGHDFIAAAAEKGASAFITARKMESVSLPHVEVADTRLALGALAAYYRSLFEIPVIAVTGSSGKTSVKNGLAAVLGRKYNVLKTEGNLNNDIGLPLTVFGLNREHTAAVLEMGMNNPGEISYLSKIAKPDIGVITNSGTAHIGRLGSREAILSAKLEIADGMDENSTLILNYDNDMLRSVKGMPRQKTVWVSALEKADVYADNIEYTHDLGAKFDICFSNRAVPARLPEAAPQLIANALITAAAGFLLGLSDEQIQNGVAQGASESRRLERHKTKDGGVIINDCYNANTDSMRLALDILSKYEMRKVAILGDMFEQGKFAAELHEEIGEYAYDCGVELLVAVGNDARFYKSAFDRRNTGGGKCLHFESKRELFDAGLDFGGDTALLLKASRGMKFEEIFDYIRGKQYDS